MKAKPLKKRYEGFTAEEKSAMAARVKEMKTGDQNTEDEFLAKIAELPAADRALAERLHAIAQKSVPALTPRLWYGMPAWAKDGKIIFHFVPAQKFKTRYASFAFSDSAKLDEGAMWPNGYALTKLTAAEEKTIGSLIRKAAG